MAFADIAIAIVGPITGQYAMFGAQMKEGAEHAVADLNAKGGVLGQKLALEVGDDGCNPKQAITVAKEMAGKKIAFMAGHFCSSSSIPASAVYAEARIVQISPASTDPKYTDERPGNGTLRVSGRADQQGAIAGAFLAEKFADKKVAFIDDKSPYGKDLADNTRKHYQAAGKKEVLDDEYNAGERDYSALVSKLKDAQVDVLYVGGYPTEAGLIVRQMRDRGMRTILVAGDALVTDEYWQIAGDAGEGTLMTFLPDPRKNPEAADVVKDFIAKNIDPEGYVFNTYAAIQVWAQAATAAGSTDYDKVVEALYSKGPFKTVLGEVTFNDNGDVKLPGYKVYVWHAGKYDYLE